jgi:hypothetical protein
MADVNMNEVPNAVWQDFNARWQALKVLLP